MKLSFIVGLAFLTAASADAAPSAADDGHVPWKDAREAMRAIRTYSHPPYPYQARSDHRMLAAMVRMYVAPDGKVTRTRTLVMTGDQGLLRYAENYIRWNYRFPRPLVGGKPANVYYDLPLVFVLVGRAKELREKAVRLGPPAAQLLKILDREAALDAERDRLRRSIRVPAYQR